MLTSSERAHLRGLARHAIGGRFVELGTFLGASSECVFAGAGDRLSEREPLLVYDAFLTTPDMHDLYPMPTRAGESFRGLFDLFQRDRLPRMRVREGLMPEDAGPEECREVYPEGQEIAFLFVDLAKTAGVHRTVARSFFPFLTESARVVQQDFKHPYCYWLPLHMHELRRWFTIEECVPGWTVTFRCSAPPSSEACRDGLRGDLITTEAEIEACWDEVSEWLDGARFSGARPPMDFHRALHLLRAERWGAACRCIERGAEAWVANLPSDAEELNAVCSNADFVAWTLEEYASVGAPPGVARAAAFLREWAQAIRPEENEALRLALWRQVAETLRAEGRVNVALIGGGTHARWLLATGWPHGRVEVAAVLDDERSPGGVPDVCSPESFSGPLDAVVVCSESNESSLAERAAEVFGPRGVPVVSVYDASSPPAAAAGANA